MTNAIVSHDEQKISSASFIKAAIYIVLPVVVIAEHYFGFIHINRFFRIFLQKQQMGKASGHRQ